jgi:predicted RNA-binding Zn ribbon-like protein
MSRTLPESLGVTLPLLAVARSAENLLADPVRVAVRPCPGEDCGWLLLDRRAVVHAHLVRQWGEPRAVVYRHS